MLCEPTRSSAGARSARQVCSPHLEGVARSSFVFRHSFGLDVLPEEPGLILVRGARQYGKSTWLEGQLKATVEDHGPGSAFYLNGDELPDAEALVRAIRDLLPLYRTEVRIRRLFIDELTAVRDWERGLKRLLDGGDLRDVLVVTTGSKAADLRRGSERLPGRKGRLERTSYLFTPISFSEFDRQCRTRLGSDTLPAYLLSGGSPVACAELADYGRIPEFVVETTRDWIYGDLAASGRSRASLLGVMECLHRFGGTPVGQAKLAREAGLANNTVAAGYVEQLMDLLCVCEGFAWDVTRKRSNRRRPRKFHITNLLVAASWHPARIRSVSEFRALSGEQQGRLIEWLVAQELWRRAAIRGDEIPERLHFYQSKSHGLDFVVDGEQHVQVKRGRASPLEFDWWPRTFPQGHLTVVSDERFDAGRIRGVTLEDFLLEE